MDMMTQLEKVLPRRLLYGLVSPLLYHYPLRPKHKKILLKDSLTPNVAMGVICDHLLSVAAKQGVPRTYLEDLSIRRRRHKGHQAGLELRIATRRLISAVIEIANRE